MASPFSCSKATSLGSQSSVSASADVTAPNPTPLTEALNSEIVDPPPEIDFQAMTRTLVTIAEALNESAEEAMFPSPPINTPVITSPATSVVYRYPHVRNRGMSTIHDRLARAVTECHNFYHDSDIVSTSDHSICSSVPANDESDSTSNHLSGGERDRHDITIALGSPRVSKTGVDSFASNDLVDRAPVVSNGTNIGKSTREKDTSSRSLHSESLKNTACGVAEMNTWKEEVEGRFERALKCLENLARDEYQLDPNKPTEHYYVAHLKRLLGAQQRSYPVYVNLMDKSH